MPRGDKYKELGTFLRKSGVSEIMITYSKIEEIIRDKLPKSAYKHPEQWWSNNYSHSQAVAWMDAGYETNFVTDQNKYENVTFVRVNNNKKR